MWNAYEEFSDAPTNQPRHPLTPLEWRALGRGKGHWTEDKPMAYCCYESIFEDTSHPFESPDSPRRWRDPDHPNKKKPWPIATEPLEDIMSDALLESIDPQFRDATRIAVDGTVVKSWATYKAVGARIPKRRKSVDDEQEYYKTPLPLKRSDGRLQVCYDPDAQIGHASGNQKERARPLLSYMPHLAVTRPKGRADTPELIIGVVPRPNDNRNNRALFDLVKQIERHGLKVGQISADMGYAPGVLYGSLTKHGIALVSDLPDDEFGVWYEGPLPGTIWLNGSLFREEILGRKDLMGLPKLTKGNHKILAARYDKCLEYAYRPDNGIDTETGKVVFASPIANGRMVCHNHSGLAKNAEDKPLTNCDDLIDPDGKCPCLKSVTVYPKTKTSKKGEGLPLNFQRLVYGTTAWQKEYYGVREHVESANSLVKFHYQQWTEGFSHVMGLAKNTILLFISAIAANLISQRVWARTRGMEDPLDHPAR